MTTRQVTTKHELEKAQNDKVNEIIVIGKLANDLHKTKKITQLGAGTLAILAAALLATPFTGGGSLVAGAMPIAALTGLEISSIIIAASVGLALIIAVFKDYEEISFSDGRLVLKKKG